MDDAPVGWFGVDVKDGARRIGPMPEAPHPAPRGTMVVNGPGSLGGTRVVKGTRVRTGSILVGGPHRPSRFDIFRHSPSLPPGGMDAVLNGKKAGRPFRTTRSSWTNASLPTSAPSLTSVTTPRPA